MCRRSWWCPSVDAGNGGLSVSVVLFYARGMNAEKAKKIDTYIGARIRALRGVKGIRQEDLAKRIGVKFQQLQKYETGINRVSASRLVMIAGALDVPVAELFGKFGGVGDPAVLDKVRLRHRSVADFIHQVMKLKDGDRTEIIKKVNSLVGNSRGGRPRRGVR